MVGKNGRKLEAGKETLPRAIEHASDHNLVPLIKLRKSSIQPELSRVLRSVVRIEVRGSVEALAEGVVPKQHEVVTKTLLHLQDQPFVQGRRRGGVLIVLSNQRIHKAVEGLIRVCHCRRARQRRRFGGEHPTE